MIRRPIEVKSPCISVCEMDEPSGLCKGCLRTRQEIARWPFSLPSEKEEILRAIDARRRGS